MLVFYCKSQLPVILPGNIHFHHHLQFHQQFHHQKPYPTTPSFHSPNHHLIADTSRHLQPSSPTKNPTIPTAPPTQTPRTLQEALKLIIGLSPVSVNGTTYTPTQFQPTREVIPIATEIIENLLTDGPQEVPRETLLKVADEYMAMSHTVKLLEDGLHDALRERDALYAQLIAYEKELKDQVKEFEDRRKQERLLLEALYGDDDAEELLAPGENRIVED